MLVREFARVRLTGGGCGVGCFGGGGAVVRFLSKFFVCRNRFPDSSGGGITLEPFGGGFHFGFASPPGFFGSVPGGGVGDAVGDAGAFFCCLQDGTGDPVGVAGVGDGLAGGGGWLVGLPGFGFPLGGSGDLGFLTSSLAPTD